MSLSEHQISRIKSQREPNALEIVKTFFKIIVILDYVKKNVFVTRHQEVVLFGLSTPHQCQALARKSFILFLYLSLDSSLMISCLFHLLHN